MSAKHTPGPWKIEPSIPEEGVKCIWIKGANTESYRPEIGAVFAPQHEKAFSDARLIAAAPELLGALESMLEHAEFSTQQGREAFAKARAAITKATAPQSKEGGGE